MKETSVEWIRRHIAHTSEDCLIWPFGMVRGYGQLKYHGQFTRASRVMCIEAHGEPPSPDHHAAHDCGNSACVNPRHIKWKTPSENQLDKRRHGRFYQGGARKRLSYADALKVRSLAGRMTQDAIAEMFGVSRRNIGAILSGRSQNRARNRERIASVLADATAPMSYREIADVAGIPAGSASSMLVKLKGDGLVVHMPNGLYVTAPNTPPDDPTR